MRFSLALPLGELAPQVTERALQYREAPEGFAFGIVLCFL